MRIVEISHDECKDFLGSVSVGRLGCSLEDQPYVVPTCFVYEPEHLYVFSIGSKDRMDAQKSKGLFANRSTRRPIELDQRGSAWDVC